MSDRSDRDRRELISDPTEGPTWPKGAKAEKPTLPYLETAPDSVDARPPSLRRPVATEKKITLRDLAVPTPNQKPTLPYLDRQPPSDPQAPRPREVENSADSDDITHLRLPAEPESENVTQLRLPAEPESEDVTQLRLSAEPIPFYIERDSVPAPPSIPEADSSDSSPTRHLPTLDEATTLLKPNQRPSAMNLGKLASPRFGGVGEAVRIASGKPSAMRLNRVDRDALPGVPSVLEIGTDVSTDAPVETLTEPRPSLSGQRLHRALPILTGLAFIAIGAVTAVLVLRDSGRSAAPVPTTAVPAPEPRPVSRPAVTSATPSPTTLTTPTQAPAPTQTAAVPTPDPSASTASPTRRKNPISRPPPQRSPSPKSQNDGLGELPF